MDRSQIRRWEVTGILLISLTGSALHFVFEWSSSWRPLALFATVNESTWEHLKLAFWPALFYALAEWIVWGRSAPGFWAAKAFGLTAMPVAIVVLFYGYKALLGHDLLWLDISIFLVAVIIGQWLSYRLIIKPPSLPAQRAAWLLLAMLIVAFSLLTYFAPRFFLFQDPHSHQYGILDGM